MQVHLTEFTDTSRVYVRANEEIFSKLFRKITVPKLTDVEFVRDDDARVINILLKVNYGYDKESNESSEVVISDGIFSTQAMNRHFQETESCLVHRVQVRVLLLIATA